MFARTERLLLRPGWPEDAPALSKAIADETIVRNLATAPWPYGLAEAQAFLGRVHDPLLPSMLIFARFGGEPELIGACGLSLRPSGAIELGYWIARAHWNCGFATEAGRQVVEIARTLGLSSLQACHFIDNPASGRVLEKLGFRSTGMTAPRHSCARASEATAALFRLELAAPAASLAA